MKIEVVIRELIEDEWHVGRRGQDHLCGKKRGEGRGGWKVATDFGVYIAQKQ